MASSGSTSSSGSPAGEEASSGEPMQRSRMNSRATSRGLDVSPRSKQAWDHYGKIRCSRTQCRSNSPSSEKRAEPLRLAAAAANVADRLSSSAKIEAWLPQLGFYGTRFDIIFVSEFDTCQRSLVWHKVRGWIVMRFWPGPGSRAMTWLVRSSLTHHTIWKQWQHRAGTLLLADSECNHSCLIDIHGSHCSTDLQEDFSNIAWMAAQRPEGSALTIMGDWSVNLLPNMEGDPYALSPTRSQMPQ